MPGSSSYDRFPWKLWPLEKWVEYRRAQVEHLERDPDHKPTRENLRLADIHIAAHKEAETCGTRSALSTTSSEVQSVANRRSSE